MNKARAFPRCMAFFLLFLPVFHGSALDTPPLANIFGAPNASAISGNGGLTVSVGALGQLTACRWPSPGYFNQLSCGTVAPQDRRTDMKLGALWAVCTQRALYWPALDAASHEVAYRTPRSTAIISVDHFPNTDFTTRQTLFVHKDRDLLAVRLELSGLDKPARLFWQADFTPCTRVLPECPLADCALDALNDFAAFADPRAKTLYHFRPASLRADDWRRARELVARRAGPAEWYAFGDGVWIGCASPNTWLGVSCGTDGETRQEIESGTFSSQTAAVGDCQSALELEPSLHGNTQSAVVFAACAKTRDQVDALLKDALKEGFDAMLAATEEHWSNWLGGTAAANDVDPVRQRCLLTLAQATDRKSGAIAAAPVSPSPYALDFPSDGAWATLALDMAGCTAAAERHLRFYETLVRKGNKRGMPNGSHPVAAYTSGVEAAPHFILETDSAAWVLASCWRHAQSLKEPARLAYLKTAWEATELMGHFLTHWTEGTAGAPLHSFQRDCLRDRQTEASLWTTFMGVTAATNIAHALNRDEARDWADRQNELKSLIQFHRLNDPAALMIPATLPYWLEGVIPRAGNSAWDIWQTEVERDGQRVPLAKTTFPIDAIRSETEGKIFFDSGAAALRFIAETLVQAPNP